jgi:hypothetical protein
MKEIFFSISTMIDPVKRVFPIRSHTLWLSIKQPLKCWSIGIHLGLAASLLFVTGIGSLTLLHQKNKDLEIQQVQKSQLHTQQITLQSQPLAPNFTQTLPSVAHADDVTAALNREANALGIQISSLTVTEHVASAQALGHVQFTIALLGDYLGSKALLAALLDRFPSLGVQSLSIHDASGPVAKLETQLVLSLFVQ